MINSLKKIKQFNFSYAKQWIQPPTQIKKKSIQLANMIKNSSYPIVFTGAGCSTSLGIPDYRSGQNTVVPTGPGIWNRTKQDTPPKISIDKIVDDAIPSITHMAIKTLLQKDVFKFLVSQNTDGLHSKSGVGFNKISELHGNRNVQKCVKCDRKYFRDYRTIKRGPRVQAQNNHETGRNCENCGGKLLDSIVYFGQKLPLVDLTNAIQQAAKCDFLLCIGSSLTVKPSSNVPLIALRSKAKLSIINIQHTPFDQFCTLKINSFCDELNIQIERFRYEHYLSIQVKGQKLIIEGKDKQHNNYTYIKSIRYQDIQLKPEQNKIVIPFNSKDHSAHQLQVVPYGNKPAFTIHLPTYFKLYHGEGVNLKVWKYYNEPNWVIQQI